MSSVTLMPEADALVDQGAPTTNYGSAGYLCAGFASNGAAPVVGLCRTWLRFNLGSIPVGSTINSATLKLLLFQGNGGDNYSALFLLIQRSTNITWVESTITWNTADNASVSGATSGSIDCISSNPFEADINLTTDVAAAFASGKVTWRIREDISGVESIDGGELMQSKDYPGATYPNLVITYTPPASSRRRAAAA